MLVKQICNLFELMDVFVRVRRPLSAREIVDQLSLPRSSVFNIVSTLVELGYLYQPVARGGYYPTSRWMDLARDLSDSQPLPPSVHGLLVQLMEKTGETIVLASAEGTSIVLTDVVESPAEIRYSVNVGARLPIHVTAAGRAILAQYGAEERAAVLQRIKYERHATGAFMSADAVEQDIRNYTPKGWFVNLANYADGLAGVAVPFPFRNRRNAIVLGAPVSRVKERVSSLGNILRREVGRFLKAEDPAPRTRAC